MTGILTAPAGINVETWANEIIRQAREDLGGPLPVYGSQDWSHAETPHRWASAIAAAETRRRENTPAAIAEQLARDLWLERLKQLDDEHFAAAAAAWKQHWRWLARHTGTHAHRPTGPSAGQLALAWAYTPDEPIGVAA